MKVAVLCGGVGAARFLRGLVQVLPGPDITAIVNVADDIVLHGLHISPDLDTCTYTLAGAINGETGWGLAGETWHAMESVARYGGENWFNLGDKDLGTHLFRTQRLHSGATLSEVTTEITAAWDLDLKIMPVTDDRIETRVTVDGEGEIGFQEYFVGRRHGVPISAIRFVGATEARPAPGVLEAIQTADAVIIAPSNPLVSIGPLLAVPGLTEALIHRRDQVVAISPIVAGAALKGPADRMLTELGHESSVVGVARLYHSFAATLVVDTADATATAGIEDAGMHVLITPTIMKTPERAAKLARTVLQVPV